MLKMQVPDGKPKAGMVHHKIHDKEWTALGMRPDQDAQPRFLWPPSTAATLNLAADGGAVRAHLARSWTRRSPAGAWPPPRRPGRRRSRTRRCSRARRRSAAGPTTTRTSATSSTGRRRSSTSRPRRTCTRRSSRSRRTTRRSTTLDGDDRIPTSMTWGAVGALGTITLATVPNGLAAKDDRRQQGRDQGGRRQLRRAGRPAGLPGAVQARQEGLPVGLELVRAQQRDHHGAGVTTSRATRST